VKLGLASPAAAALVLSNLGFLLEPTAHGREPFFDKGTGALSRFLLWDIGDIFLSVYLFLLYGKSRNG
jgi:hypothetical protein